MAPVPPEEDASRSAWSGALTAARLVKLGTNPQNPPSAPVQLAAVIWAKKLLRVGSSALQRKLERVIWSTPARKLLRAEASGAAKSA